MRLYTLYTLKTCLQFYSHLHLLGKLRRLVVDVDHSYPYRGRSCTWHLPLVNSHDNKLVQMIGSLEVQRTRGEDGAVRGDGEIWTQGVIGQLCILLRVTVIG